MGGWISIIGTIPDFESRISKFKQVFSVDNVPDLRVEIHDEVEGIRIIGWAWNQFNIPDLYISGINNNHILVLSGVITDLGRYGPILSDQDQTASRILELWLEHSEKVIDQLNGSFSCLFYDKDEKKTSLFVDRFASRSVWVTSENGILIVGNFPSAIAAMKKEKPRIDPVGLWSLIHAGRHLGSYGLYSNINTLLAGQKAVFSLDSRIIMGQWWERKYEAENNLSAKEWGYRLTEALKNSADRYRKVSKNPYLFLSGGLDSRVVAAAFKKPLETITLCTNPNAESFIASMVSKTIGLEHQTIVRSPYWYLDTMNASALIGSGNHLNHHTHFIVPIKNITSGNSDSEFLLGDLLENLNKHYFSMSPNQQLIFEPENIKDFLYSNVPYTLKNPGHIGIYFNDNLKLILKKRYEDALKEYAATILKVSGNHADRFDTFLRWADVSVTPTYNMIACIWPLAKERNLYFDNNLNELSLKIPANFRGGGMLHKWILYHLNKKLLLIPDANHFLPPVFPNKLKVLTKKIRPFLGNLRRGLIRRRKENEPILRTSGSWLLLHEMYRKDGHYRERIGRLLFDKGVFPPEIFDTEEIQKNMAGICGW